MQQKSYFEISLITALVLIYVLYLNNFVLPSFCSDETRTVSPGYSIQDAINNANEGDTIIVEAGIYYESEIVVNKTVNIIGQDAEKTVIDGNNTAKYIFHVIANNARIENFTLKNTNPDHISYSCAVQIYNVTGVEVKNLIITDVVIGIHIQSSNFTEILNNKIVMCTVWALEVHGSSCNNTIAGNTFANNPTAINFADDQSKFNAVYHNNFINNTHNVSLFAMNNYLDNGYPSGGNYWSNFTSTDSFSGPNQNESGSDGIFDTEYPSHDSRLDRYPLVNPLTTFYVLVNEEIFTVKISTNSTVNSCIFSKENRTLTFNVNESENANYSCRLIIPKKLLSCDSLREWNVSANGYVIDYVVLDDEENTYIYFIYSNVNIEEITVEGTRALPELNPTVTIAMLLSLTAFLIALKRICKKNKDQLNIFQLSNSYTNDVFRLQIKGYVFRSCFSTTNRKFHRKTVHGLVYPGYIPF